MESVESAGTKMLILLQICLRAGAPSGVNILCLRPYICLTEQNALFSPPLQVERGWFPGLSDELLHQAHLLLQHHSGQPVPRRSPLQSHVPEDFGD